MPGIATQRVANRGMIEQMRIVRVELAHITEVLNGVHPRQHLDRSGFLVERSRHCVFQFPYHFDWALGFMRL